MKKKLLLGPVIMTMLGFSVSNAVHANSDALDEAIEDGVVSSSITCNVTDPDGGRGDSYTLNVDRSSTLNEGELIYSIPGMSPLESYSTLHPSGSIYSSGGSYDVLGVGENCGAIRDLSANISSPIPSVSFDDQAQWVQNPESNQFLRNYALSSDGGVRPPVSALSSGFSIDPALKWAVGSGPSINEDYATSFPGPLRNEHTNLVSVDEEGNISSEDNEVMYSSPRDLQYDDSQVDYEYVETTNFRGGLRDYAVVTQSQSRFGQGEVVMYAAYEDGGETHFVDRPMPTISEEDFGCVLGNDSPRCDLDRNEAKVDLTLDETNYQSDSLQGSIEIENDFESDRSISAPCDDSGSSNEAQCSGNRTEAGIRIVDNSGLPIVTENFTYDAIPQGSTDTISLDALDISIPVSGTYYVQAFIPHYLDEGIRTNSNVTEPQEINIDASGEVSVDVLSTKDRYPTTSYFDPEIAIHNNLNARISSSCEDPSDGYEACSSGNQTFNYTISNGGAVVSEGVFPVTTVGRDGGSYYYDLGEEEILLNSSGEHTLEVEIPNFDGDENTANSTASYTFEATNDQNTSVEIEGPSALVDGDSSSHRIIVTNEMNTAISGNVDVEVVNSSTRETYDHFAIPYEDIEVGESETLSLSPRRIQPEIGTYEIIASIENRPGEVTTVDNDDTFEYRVRPFVPENLECNGIESEYLNVTGEGPDHATKMCVGRLPNYPSTETEGGQGTFFYVGYYFHPLPLPAYDIENLDEAGLEQAYSNPSDPEDASGSCDPATPNNDDDCDITNSFLYYPRDIDNRQDLRGPFEAGPNEFKHFLYRGRMFPTTTTFHFTLTDPSGNYLHSEDDEVIGSGEIVYEIDRDQCFMDDQLDISDECRFAQFYFPRDDASGHGSASDPYQIPEDSNQIRDGNDDNIQFQNPGIHRFDLRVEEEQSYRYQFDDGREWQGDEGVPNESGVGPVNTHTVEDGPDGELIWVEQDDFLNRCYTEEDAYGDTVEENCYHNQDEDFHYWNYNWTDVQDYGRVY